MQIIEYSINYCEVTKNKKYKLIKNINYMYIVYLNSGCQKHAILDYNYWFENKLLTSQDK